MVARTFLVVVTLLATGCLQPQAQPAATPPPSPPATSATSGTADRGADLELLVRAYATHHPDPPDLAGPIADLRERAPDLTPEQFLVEIMRITAGREGDGHSGVFPLGQPDLELWPLQLYAFDDGWRVVAAMNPYGGLIGGVVTAVGGVSVEEAAESVALLVPRDNHASVLGRLPQYLVVPAILEGLGLEPTITVDGELLTPEPVPAGAYAGWLDLFYPLVCPPLPRPTDELWDVDHLEGAVVVRYRRTVSQADGRTASRFADEVRHATNSNDRPILVVDLRDNPGGDIDAYVPLLAAVQEIADGHPGAVRLLVNRCTFSAASQFVAEVLSVTDAIVVGETMGGSTRQWGDARTTRLPASGIVVHVASRWHERGGPDVPTVIEPDVAVPVSSADREAGRDPVLEAAIRRH